MSGAQDKSILQSHLQDNKSYPLTADMLHRELNILQEKIEGRLESQDRAANAFKEDLTRVPTRVQEAVTNLRDLMHSDMKALTELMIEKFDGVKRQFDERDIRVQQAAESSRTAIDAALKAQKEAVGEQNVSNSKAIQKSEELITKQIDQLKTQMESSNLNTNDRINDVK